MLILASQFINIFQLIANNYLTYLEKIYLSQIIPIKLQNFDDDIKRVFKKNKISYNNFISKFSENTFCTGGILLGILLDNIYEKSDIDLYHFKYKDNTYFPLNIIEIDTGPDLYEGSNREIRKYEKIIFKGEFRNIYDLYTIKTEGTSGDGKMYQHNTLLEKTKSIFKYINESADFDFTKIIYFRGKLYIKNIDSIIKKECDYDIIKSFNHQIYHFIKYNKSEWIHNFIESIIDKKIARINKYISRGYKINLYYDSKIKISNNIYINIFKHICDKYLIYSIDDLKRLSNIKILKDGWNINPYLNKKFKKIYDFEKYSLSEYQKNDYRTVFKFDQNFLKEFDDIMNKYDLRINVKISLDGLDNLLTESKKIIDKKKLMKEYEKIKLYYLNS